MTSKYKNKGKPLYCCRLYCMIIQSSSVCVQKRRFTHHQHWRPDSLRHALPQLCRGARFVEPPGELPRLGWSRSHAVSHLSSDSQVVRKSRLVPSGGEEKQTKKKAGILRSGLSDVRKNAPWRWFHPGITLLFNFAWARLYVQWGSGTEWGWLPWWKAVGEQHPEAAALCPVRRSRAQNRHAPLPRCNNNARRDSSVDWFIHHILQPVCRKAFAPLSTIWLLSVVLL